MAPSPESRTHEDAPVAEAVAVEVPPLQLGAVLILHTRTKKEKYDNKKVKLLDVVRSGTHYKVEMLEGPNKEEVITRPKEQFVVDSAPAPTLPAAESAGTGSVEPASGGA